MRIRIHLLTLTVPLLMGLYASAYAEDAVASASASASAKIALTARAGEHPDFDRIVFDWPRPTPYHLHRDGANVTLAFDAPADAHFNGFSFLTRARGFAASVDAKGNLVVSFTVDAKASLKDFTSGNSIAVDIVGATSPTPEKQVPPQPAAQPNSGQSQPVAATIQPPTLATPAPASPSVASANPPAASQSPPPSNSASAPIPPSAPVASAPPATGAPTPLLSPKESARPSVPAAPSATQTVKVQPSVPPVSIKPDAAPPAPVPPTSAAVPTLSVETKAVSAPDVVPALGPVPAPAPAPVVSKPVLTDSSGKPLELGDTPVQIAALDPHVEARAVIWQRGGYGYVVFDRKFTLSSRDLAAGQMTPRVTFEPLELAKSSGLRFAVPDNATVQATRDGTVWKIYLTGQQPDVAVSSTLVAQPDFALGARNLLPLPDAPEPVRLTDPVVGDDLVLIPLEQTQAFSVARRMSDFQILPAAQGLVIKPQNDKLIVRAVSDGIEITAEGGLRISGSNDTGEAQQSSQKAKAKVAGKSLFDFAVWRGKPDETFTQTRQRLQQTIVDVPERERNRARLELARFYFANGNGEEAVALLAWLAKQVPDLTAHADFQALDGAAKILAYHPEDGLQELAQSSFKEQPEIELWQAVGEAGIRNWTEAEEKFALSENILAGYPEPFYSRFMVLAIESASAVGNDHEAADWLDRLQGGPHAREIEPAISYLSGVLHAKSGRIQAAKDAWKDAVAATDHLYKIRAELALVDLDVANGSLTVAQAADRLEALRFGWRGDDLELDILHRLGGFYIQAKNVKAGLSALSQGVQLYPNSPMTQRIRQEMAQVFHDIFLGELGKNISPLDTLTLYQQYRNLMPSGDDGIAVTRNLAERLVAIDLLEQAGDLLEELVKYRLQGDDKGKVSARLAAIRLLDHKPDAALAGLTYADSGSFPADLQNERQLLRAKALSDLHRDDEALALLQNNPRDSAKLLRADITMHAQRWADAAKTLMDLVGPPPKAGETLSNDQAAWLVNSAIAYSLAGDQTGLDKLAIDYGTAMASTPQADTFGLLTRPEKEGQMKDIAAAQSRIADVNLFQGFLDSYRKTAGDIPADQKPADNDQKSADKK